ncbi:MAG: hypothetical protein ABI358_06660 [Ginsengibacter sp.]
MNKFNAWLFFPSISSMRRSYTRGNGDLNTPPGELRIAGGYIYGIEK